MHETFDFYIGKKIAFDSLTRRLVEFKYVRQDHVGAAGSLRLKRPADAVLECPGWICQKSPPGIAQIRDGLPGLETIFCIDGVPPGNVQFHEVT